MAAFEQKLQRDEKVSCAGLGTGTQIRGHVTQMSKSVCGLRLEKPELHGEYLGTVVEEGVRS